MSTFDIIIGYLAELNKDSDPARGIYGYFEPCTILFTKTEAGTQKNDVWFQGLSDLEVKEKLEEAFGFKAPAISEKAPLKGKITTIDVLPLAAETSEK